MRNNLIIDRVVRLYVRDYSTNNVKFYLDQLQDVSTSATLESQEVVDAIGALIDEIARSKAFELSGNHALYHTGLQAEQFGTVLETSTANKTFRAPAAEEIEYAKGATSVTLAHTPADTTAIPAIYLLVDGTVGTKYEYAAQAAADKFTFSGTTLTLPTGLATDAGGTILAVYDYEANGTDVVNKIANDADKFPEVVNVLMQVLYRDVCNPNKKIAGYLELKRAKFSGEVDNDITPDGNHPFTIRAYKEYCAKDQNLCTYYFEEDGE